MHVKHLGAPLEKSFGWTPSVLGLQLFQCVEGFSHIYLVYYLSNNRNSDIFKIIRNSDAPVVSPCLVSGSLPPPFCGTAKCTLQASVKDGFCYRFTLSKYTQSWLFSSHPTLSPVMPQDFVASILISNGRVYFEGIKLLNQ